ncbi:hypothetical protein [Nonomuraea sp. NEAU-A123]|uniref:hypothetical protein n=1 Tax=Nonomuraea sp. NEAU-A123 TaxID=2839649 RepID=UPI001BE4CD38|nr:hypothetical protein [Nonomuraea sp. NEAU-A123]MBT2225659.1 hypothetical protein [Nonomuraea sp. NEAU-A123]
MANHDHNEADRLDLCHHALIDDLRTVLDIEAGLREALLHSHHAAQLDDLDTIVNVETGLAAILPATSAVAPQAQDESRPLTPEQLLEAVSPQDRLTLRRTPHVLDLARDLARTLDHTLNHARALDRAHIRARAFALDPDLDLDPDPDRNLASARALARDLDRLREYDFVAPPFHAVRRAIREALGRDVPLAAASVRTFLDDFTASDLRSLRLADIDLEGVRWSETGTRWPEEVDIDDLKAHSEEIGAGSGLYVVRRGWTVRSFVDLA